MSAEFRTKIRLNKYNANENLSVKNTSDENYLNTSVSEINLLSMAMKLPKLNILKFSGDAGKWLEFFNSFQTGIDQNKALTKTEKFVYLKSLMIGQAYNVVEGFQLTKQNYDSCLKKKRNFAFKRMLCAIQCSYIKKQLSKEVGLKVVGREEIMIHTFGSQVPKKQNCMQVKMKSSFDNEELIIEVSETNKISNAELDYSPENIKELLKVRGIILVGVDHESLENVPLLIRADNYWNHHIDLNSFEYPETTGNLKESFYVDNCITSVPDEETLSQFIKESKEILDSASFDLRRWEHTPLLKSKDSTESTPVLGILWDKDDGLFCDVKTATDKSINLTRRNILSAGQGIYSDLLTGTKLSEVLQQSKFSGSLNTPTAAWWGGWWERLVQIIRKLLRRVLGKALLSYEEMLTITCDAEANINSRPLTYESEDSTNLCALTPSMFIQDIRTEGIPDLDSLDKINLSKRWQYHQKLCVEFRKRFRDEYLGLLVHRPKTVPLQIIKEGDLVFVEDDRRKRTDWPMGCVIETYPRKDNNTRVVKVETSSGELLRSVQRIFPIQIDHKESIFELKTTESSTSSGNTGKKEDLVTDTKECALENFDKNIQ
ncbi:hypothetical protein X975_18690, partial [Stegodyphus mimosarum]